MLRRKVSDGYIKCLHILGHVTSAALHIVTVMLRTDGEIYSVAKHASEELQAAMKKLQELCAALEER